MLRVRDGYRGVAGKTRPTAAVRLVTSSRWKMFSRCLRTVAGEITSARAMSRLL